MAYTKQTWTDGPGGGTPITAAKLNHIEDGIVAAGTTSDATTTAKGVVQLAGDLAGTAAAPTVPGLAAKAPIASPTFTGTVGGITKAMVGLGNVDNTADTAKPISTATQTALNAKLDVTTAASTYVAKTDAIDLEGMQDSVAGMFTAGIHSGISFAYDDPNGRINATVTPGSVADATTTTKGAVQLAGDLAGTAAAPTVPGLAGKAPLASPTFTGTVSGITAAMVGLGNVNNTADTAKPVSTAQQTALNAKAPLLTPTATKTAAYTAAVGDLAMMNVAGGATTLTLPTAPADKSQVGYRAIGATTAVPLVVNRGGTDTIGTTGATSASLPMADEVVVLQYDAANTRWLGVSAVKTQASLDARFDASGAASTAQAFAIQRANHSGTQAASTITGLATVATSGAYADLSGKPTIPTNTVSSTTVTTIVTLTAAAYAALGTKDAATLYVVSG